MRDDAILELRRRLYEPWPVIEQLGLAEGAMREPGGFKILCPGHIERSPSCSVRVGRDGTLACHCFGGCALDGNVFHLIGAARGLDVHRDFQQVVAIAAELAGTTLADLEQRHEPARARPRLPAMTPAAPPAASQQPIAAPQRPPLEELRALWRASEAADVTSGVAATEDEINVCRFFARRRWWPRSVAALRSVRVLPGPGAYDFPKWWPSLWSSIWRVAALVYEPDGRVGAIHARSVTDATPKTRWPWSERGKYSFGGLLFADVAGRELLQGRPREGLAGVVITEGITDFIAAGVSMVETGGRYAILGGTSGSWSALARVPWPQGVVVVVATDHDDAGEKYAVEIARVVPKHVRLRRWKPPELEHQAG
jgi:hypothetical protein